MSSVIQRALSGGELDPVLWARSDVTKYQMGLKTLRNAYVRRNGGIQIRPGSTLIQATKNNGNTVRLVPFIFSQTVTYAMEFGNNYIRFYQNGQPYLAQGAAAYNAGTNYVMGNLVTYLGVTYICVNNLSTYLGASYGNFYPNITLYSLPGGNNAAPTTSGVTPGTNANVWYALTSGIYEIPTPYSYADLPLLRFDQTANDMVFTHPSYPQMRLTRSQSGGFDVFNLYLVLIGSYSFGPGYHVGGTTHYFTNNQSDANTLSIASAATVYGISPVLADGDIYAEPVSAAGLQQLTLGVNCTTTNSVPSGGAPIGLGWPSLPGAVSYNIYYFNKNAGVFGFIGSTPQNTFVDSGITPNYSNTWVQGNTILSSAGNYPSACAFYQQRLFYGNTNNQQTTVWGSQTGLYDNFNISVPTLATDSLSFKMAGQQDTVQHLVSLGILIVFTYGTINSIQGDGAGAISPSSINPHRESVHGASSLRPLIVGEFCLYVQSQGAIIRDLGFNFQVDGYRGDDLTVFATHLFDNYTIVDWAYQTVPHSIAWAVRSDGTMLSLTYVREQQILGWAHHDTTAGFWENVCCIPEGNQVSVYAVANRTINGTNTRFVERFVNQSFTDVRNYIGMDCSTSVDGRNTTSDTLKLTGGTNWNELELLTATLSGNNFLTFTSGMATNNDYLFIYDSSGNLYRFKITAYSSATVVQGFVDRQLPVSLQNPASPPSNWSHAVSTVTGLAYLNGQNVAVFADGDVVGSPNNPSYPVYTVSGGSVTLDKPYAVIHIGLPFITDIETLDIDVPGAMDNLGSRSKFVGEVTIYTVNSRSIFVGASSPDADLTNNPYSPVYRMTEQKLRQNEGYDSPMNLQTGKNTQTIQGQWDQNGHVFIRNVDPTPLIVSAISPEGLFPVRAG